MRMFLRLAPLALLSLAMSCGGGGGGSSQSVQPQPITVPLSMQTIALSVGVVNTTYQDQIVMQGGTSPYHFTVQGTLPPGLTLSSDGHLTGMPTSAGTFDFSVVGSDSAGSAQSVTKSFTIPVAGHQTVRNDSVADATPLPCCATLHASLSPYSTAAGVVKPDQDYYRVTAHAGDRISVESDAVATEVDTDTVLEILDENGSSMITCRVPQGTQFFSFCENDDILPGVNPNSRLDVQLSPTGSGVFIVHVRDFGGRARPEMTYDLKLTKLP